MVFSAQIADSERIFLERALADHDLAVEFLPYTRRFRQPLRTRHGQWSKRQGVVLRLRERFAGETHCERVGYGDIAPLPWFGTETLEAAIAFCQGLIDHGARLTPEALTYLPGSATAFALGSALAQLEAPLGDLQKHSSSELPICALLPAGPKALQAWQPLWQQGYRTFKWKIGVTDATQEQDLLKQLRTQLPAEAQLRLDANGGLSQRQAEQWLAVCDSLGESSSGSVTRPAIEFLEQPLAPDQLEAMRLLSQQYRTPLALDESVANLAQLQACYAAGWRGVFVVKGAIAGVPQSVLAFCLSHNLDVVFSSVFETEIGRSAVLAMAKRYGSRRALGFGVEHWLEDDGLNATGLDASGRLKTHEAEPQWPGEVGAADQIWRRLSEQMSEQKTGDVDHAA